MIRYSPNKILKKIAPGTKVEKALKNNLTVKRAALVNANQFDFLDMQSIGQVALNAIKQYKNRIADAADPDKIEAEILADPALLIQRIQNEVVTQVSGEIRGQYQGEFYIWTPSDAEEPDPEHQLNYGKKFQIGGGEQPGDRYGCRCGMDILVDDSSLNLQ